LEALLGMLLPEPARAGTHFACFSGIKAQKLTLCVRGGVAFAKGEQMNVFLFFIFLFFLYHKY
jgi:hypothetical protein